MQIAAAALWLKAKLHAPRASLAQMNLVAPTFRLGALPQDDPALAKLVEGVAELGIARELTLRTPLRDWLRKDFFAYHKALYENRPIYFPLSSEKKSFVAWTSIHRWTDQTLQTLLADHLNPVLRDLDGQINDLNQARATLDKKAAAAAEKQYGTVKRLRDELADEIGPGFTIDEPDSGEHRARFLADHPAEAAALREKERVRRERKAAKADADEPADVTDADADADAAQGYLWDETSCSCVPSGGTPCGATTCGADLVCCNASCGICTPPDGACIQIVCDQPL